jgi:hypothetical protein
MLAIIAATGCKETPKGVNEEDLKTFKPIKLFDYDGISVYRFKDGDEIIYFTNAKGNVEWTTTSSIPTRGGIIRTKHKHQTLCTKP